MAMFNFWNNKYTFILHLTDFFQMLGGIYDFGAGFLNFCTFDIFTGQFFVVGICSVHFRMFNSVSGLYSMSVANPALPSSGRITQSSHHCSGMITGSFPKVVYSFYSRRNSV